MTNISKLSKVLFALVVCSFQTRISCENLIYRSPSGEFSVIEIEDECLFTEAISRIRSTIEFETASLHADEEYLLDFMTNSNQCSVNKTPANITMRNYSTPLDEYEKKTISYVIGTLGNSSLFTIAKESSSLKEAGKTIEHVHPLNFLYHIFSNEPLIAAVHNIRKSMYWSKFFKNLKNTLNEETASNNVLPHIKSFGARLKIDSKGLIVAAKKGDWKEFINVLYKEIPRSENSGRYDM